MFRVHIVFLCSMSTLSQVSADDLTVPPSAIDGGPTRQMMTRYLKQKVSEALERRHAAYEQMTSREQLAEYQRRMREAFIQQLGGFPERTPLEAKIVGKSDADGYRLEKLIYESQPQHHVTAVLYLPVSEPPYPAVLIPSGHSRTGKAADYNQRVGILLAKFGIAALCYDPIGQGERSQLLDGSGTPRFKSTTEHTLLGASCILLGRNTATYRIWDGIRSIDYLASRKDIDATKIGVTGCSGGGTLTSYLMALDERVACAAPSCYITSFRRLIDTIGPQDGEQNIHGQIALGMDHADYLMIRAPKPTLILASTHDFFDIQGTWHTFREAKRFYTRLGFAERVDMVETDAKHGYPRLQREAMLRWMRRWLVGIDEPVTEPAFDTRPENELLCTANGQVMLLEGARSVIDLNIELSEQFEQPKRQLWKAANRYKALAQVRRITGIRKLDDLQPAKQLLVASIQRKDYRIDQLVLGPEPGIHLPALLFWPSQPTGQRYLYLHGEGKHVDAQPAGPIEQLVRAGNIVLAVDVRGTGQTGPSGNNMWGGNWDDIFLAYLLGKSVVAMRAEDVLVSGRFLSELQTDGNPSKINLIAIGVTGPAALHAAALESQLFDHIKLVGSLDSWSEVLRNPAAGGHLVNTVHGALKVYDLPDLLQSLPNVHFSGE